MKHKLLMKKGHLGQSAGVVEIPTMNAKENNIDKKVMLHNAPFSFRKRSPF